MKKLLVVAFSFSYCAWGFEDPIANSDECVLAIEHLNQGPRLNDNVWDIKNANFKKVDATKDMPLEFTLSNKTARALSGTFSVWMNDDWQVAGASNITEVVTLKPHEGRKITYVAKALPRVLPALYPVHAQFVTAQGALHPIAIFKAETPARAFTWPTRKRTLLTPGAWRLDTKMDYAVSMFVKDKTWVLKDPTKSDPISNGGFLKTSSHGWRSENTDRRCGFTCHPPYAKGVGTVAGDFTFALANVKPITFTCSVALGGVEAAPGGHNPGDGVMDRVWVKDLSGNGDFEEVCSKRVEKSGYWLDFRADLSKWAGKKITLRLASDVGPKLNSSHDLSAWANPIIYVGPNTEAPDEATWRAREAAALKKAEKGEWVLEYAGERFGVGFEPGADGGLFTGVLAFTDGQKSIAFRGFECQVDDEWALLKGTFPDVKASISAEGGALKITWQDSAAQRITRLALGPASMPAKRVYGGFGCVFENPRQFNITAGGFTISTRHVGFDYPNGLSFVQALSTPPDKVEVNASNNVARIVTHNSTTFYLVPSARSAFTAAKAFSAVSGYKAGAGVDKMLGRICLDDWSRAYKQETKNLQQAAKWGVKEALYLQHNWQRWGYDRRLPEVWPPNGDLAEFTNLFATARNLGYLYGIHDNYVDYYPDAPGFSYDLFTYNPDGTPLRAWYNPGIRSLSYRWLPQAIHPTLRRNMALERDGFHPNALFIDVFTSSFPKDTIDRAGNFYPARRNVEEWCKAWEECREVYGISDAVMVSEAGNDSQIGFIDAGESDHFPPQRLVPDTTQYTDGERVPWHDVASHGKMLLFGGGLASRYAQQEAGYVQNKVFDLRLHGYGSDDYFCTTLIGGRVPMANTFSRSTICTYWMMHDVCAILGRQEFTGFSFGENIHKQHATFGEGAAQSDVWINRMTNETWRLADGTLLPPYGFVARAGADVSAAVILQDGQRIGYARAPGCLFADARPTFLKGVYCIAASEPISATITKDNQVDIKVRWEILESVSKAFVPFTHVERVGDATHKIVFHARTEDFSAADRAIVGTHYAHILVKFPKNSPAGEYGVHYGCYDPKGPRLKIQGNTDYQNRIEGGIITLSYKGNSKEPELSWRRVKPDTSEAKRLGLNEARRMMDFGGLRTNGAFQFRYPTGGFWNTVKRIFLGENRVWEIQPLPGSDTFEAEIDLAKFGGAGVKISRVETIEPMPGSKVPTWEQKGDHLFIKCDGRALCWKLNENL